MAELRQMSQKMEQPFVKAVVDIEHAIMVVDAMLHADQEQLQLKEHVRTVRRRARPRVKSMQQSPRRSDGAHSADRRFCGPRLSGRNDVYSVGV